MGTFGPQTSSSASYFARWSLIFIFDLLASRPDWGCSQRFWFCTQKKASSGLARRTSLFFTRWDRELHPTQPKPKSIDPASAQQPIFNPDLTVFGLTWTWFNFPSISDPIPSHPVLTLSVQASSLHCTLYSTLYSVLVTSITCSYSGLSSFPSRRWVISPTPFSR